MSETATNVNTATAEELNAVPGLRGHGFEIVRYRGERERSPICASSRRCLDSLARSTVALP